ncbi:MAG: T9SS type A sorting domain-containing protein, partial [Saprospiraceae bacterium]
NPVVDNVSIHIEDVAFVDVVITDLAGSVVVKKSIDSGIENKVDVSFLPSGMYNITIVDKAGKLPAMVHKLIKL